MTGRLSKNAVSKVTKLPEIGKIKIGEKKSTGDKEYPVSLDYFRPTGRFENQFTEIIGAKPHEINIAFISDDLSEVCNQRYECWEGGRKWGESEDGYTYIIWDPNAGDLIKVKGSTEPKRKGSYITLVADTDENQRRIKAIGKWDEILTLRFVLLKLKGILGYWRFDTKAKTVSIPQIIESFDYVRERAGTIVGFPFSLTVEKVTSRNPGETRNYPVVKLVPNFSDESMLLVSDYLATGGQMNKITTKAIEAGKI